MPRRLNHKEYGWSLTYGAGQRVASEEYKDGYDKIKWRGEDLSQCLARKTKFGVAKVKVFEIC